jgi:predicted alpha/beta hydrolase
LESKVSLPPAHWNAAQAIQSMALERVQRPIWNAVLAAAWGARNAGARERFRTEVRGCTLTPHFYETEDGWRSPLWRLPPQPGSTGEPVILSTGIALNHRSLDLHEDRSLIRHLHEQGYDVFVLNHRGDDHSEAPTGTAGFDFDDIVLHDVPAAIAHVKTISGAHRIHWIGHGLGGQLLVAHLSNDGDRDIASAVNICSPVTFEPMKATARRIARVAQLMPKHWRVPIRKIQDILTAASRPQDLVVLSRRIEGPMMRSLMLEGTQDLGIGLVQQMSKWTEVGHLCDRDNRFDYTAGIKNRKVNLLAIASPDDPTCPLPAAKAAINALADGYGEWLPLEAGWGHLDPIAGADAPRVIFPKISTWLDIHRKHCWDGT